MMELLNEVTVDNGFEIRFSSNSIISESIAAALSCAYKRLKIRDFGNILTVVFVDFTELAIFDLFTRSRDEVIHINATSSTSTGDTVSQLIDDDYEIVDVSSDFDVDSECVHTWSVTFRRSTPGGTT